MLGLKLNHVSKGGTWVEMLSAVTTQMASNVQSWWIISSQTKRTSEQRIERNETQSFMQNIVNINHQFQIKHI